MSGARAEDIDWDYIVADVALSAGWTWDYALDALTMTRLGALHRQWRLYPPLRKIVAGLCCAAPETGSVVTSQRATSDRDDPSGIGALIARFPKGQVPGNR